MLEKVLNIYACSFNIILESTNQKNIEIPEKMKFSGFRFFVMILQIFHAVQCLS